MVSIKHFPVLLRYSKSYQYSVVSPSFPFCKRVKHPAICRAGVYIPLRFSFYESSRKGEVRYEVDSDKTILERIPHGWSVLKRELKMFSQEMDEKFRPDPKHFNHGDTDVVFRFDTEENLKKWKTVSDKMHNEGFSYCQLELNSEGKAVFSGVVDTAVPKDGKIRNSGYCVMKSKDKRKSFFRQDSFNWMPFTHLEMRVRGDGRNYIIGLSTNAYFDVNWFDLFTYSLHTRGGPYWQTAKIPFSKFFLTSKGYIQDTQYAVPDNKINSISIMCAKVPGPFRLEIDYIGVHVDELNFEKFAYELYWFPKDMVSG